MKGHFLLGAKNLAEPNCYLANSQSKLLVLALNQTQKWEGISSD
jgi:hypothetical protein